MKNMVFMGLLLLSSKLMAMTEQDQIRAIMAAQERAWSAGDIEGFMQGYWQSEELAFVGKSGIKHGWQTTLENYKKSYPDATAMGKLTFDILRMEVIGESAFVLGRWTLARAQDTPSGYFSLYWKKIEGQWKITIDHSS